MSSQKLYDQIYYEQGQTNQQDRNELMVKTMLQ
jgi:hypothetical protein